MNLNLKAKLNIKNLNKINLEEYEPYLDIFMIDIYGVDVFT